MESYATGHVLPVPVQYTGYTHCRPANTHARNGPYTASIDGHNDENPIVHMMRIFENYIQKNSPSQRSGASHKPSESRQITPDGAILQLIQQDPVSSLYINERLIY